MKIPNISCKITGYCNILPSEDPEKVYHALSNVLSDSEIKIEENIAKIYADSLDSLVKIFETIQSKQSQRTYLHTMQRNLYDTTTWFYLNKQAAFVNNLSLCSHDDESALGPIKLILKSNQIEDVIEWLTQE